MQVLVLFLLVAVTSAFVITSTPRSTRMSVQMADIIDTAVSAGSFKTLAAALGAANLVSTLKGPGPFTVFAPTDAAFSK